MGHPANPCTPRLQASVGVNVLDVALVPVEASQGANTEAGADTGAVAQQLPAMPLTLSCGLCLRQRFVAHTVHGLQTDGEFRPLTADRAGNVGLAVSRLA